MLWLLFDKLFRMGGGLLVGILVAKFLGPSDFGLFNYSFSFVWLFSHIVTLGTDEIILKDLISFPKLKNKILGTGLALKIIGGLLAFLLIFVATFFIIKSKDDDFILLTLIISFSMVLKNVGVIRLLFESTLNSKYNVLAENFAFIGVSFLRIYLVSIKSDIISFGYALTFEVLICFFFLIYFYVKRVGKLSEFEFDKKTAREMLHNSWPLILSGVSVMIYVKSDQFLLGLMAGNYEAGIYSVAARISEIWYFIPVAIVASFFPKIVEAKIDSVELYESRLKFLMRLLIYFSTVIAVLMTFLSKYIVILLFGNEYIDSSLPLAIHIWVGIFVFIGIASSKILVLENIQKIYLIQTSLGAITNVLLNIYLIPLYGAIGSSIATLFSYGFSFVVWFFSKKTRYIGMITLKSLAFKI
jgi:PST family polysaccharide transporter